MPKKTVAEMNPFERLHYSLGGKTFRAIVLISLILSLTAIAFGFYLYAASVRRDFRTRTWQMSATAAQFLDSKLLLEQAEQVIEVYDEMTEDERKQLSDKQSKLLEHFAGVYGEGFDEVRSVLFRIQRSNGGRAAFTAFLDLKTNRRVFLVDSDPNDSFCPPGSLDIMEEQSIRDLTQGSRDLLDGLYGVEPMQVTVIRMEPYGHRCMGGTQIGTVKGYPVYIFFDTDMNRVSELSGDFFWQYVLLLAVVTLLVLIFALRHMNRTTVRPINQLADAAQAYIMNRDNPGQVEKHFAKLDIRTGDEIEKLSLTMKSMEADLENYIENMARIAADKERIVTELTLANQIQAAMMPHIFPAFPERPEFDIYAGMDPAREVGGDFYDFFLIDPDHLCMVIADVSGKGIPAALFMMASKIILQNCAMLGSSPAEILDRTNKALCTNNQAEMFVTAWVGILELTTGKLTAANAGHEYPALYQPMGSFALYHDKHGFVLGGMDGVRYQQYEMQLAPGSKLFLYTDGVPEATDEKKALFGTERMLQALNDNAHADPEQLLSRVRDAVDDFVGNAEQFDDLTMLCLEYKGC